MTKISKESREAEAKERKLEDRDRESKENKRRIHCTRRITESDKRLNTQVARNFTVMMMTKMMKSMTKKRTLKRIDPKTCSKKSPVL